MVLSRPAASSRLWVPFALRTAGRRQAAALSGRLPPVARGAALGHGMPSPPRTSALGHGIGQQVVPLWRLLTLQAARGAVSRLSWGSLSTSWMTDGQRC